MKKILSIDGGGIRGIIPATILTEIESRTQKPISQLFDLIAGTSTGGILALALTKPDSNGKPEYSAEQLVQMYVENGDKIFHQSLWHKISTFNNLIEEKYPAAGIDKVLEDYFKKTYLKDALTEVLITSYEIERRDSFFFKSTKAKMNPKRNFLMKHVARATSAAPTYFEPKKIPTEDLTEYYALVDGGVFANNPGMCAYVEAKTMFPEENEFLVVSLGTGELTKPIYFDQAKMWGIAHWARPLLGVVFDGVSDTVDYQLQQLLPSDEEKGRRYYRFQIMLDKDTESMDNVEQINLRALKLCGEGIIRDQNDELTALCKLLVK
jgi:patatin-like phospholipase/acyl hydrolase